MMAPVLETLLTLAGALGAQCSPRDSSTEAWPVLRTGTWPHLTRTCDPCGPRPTQLPRTMLWVTGAELSPLPPQTSTGPPPDEDLALPDLVFRW
ncbi:unnamed protein product [Boreogadus saida]